MIMLLSSSPPRLRTTTKVFLRSSWPAARTVPLGAATGAYIVSKYREAYQTERIAPEVYVKDIDLETPPATLPANPALFARR